LQQLQSTIKVEAFDLLRHKPQALGQILPERQTTQIIKHIHGSGVALGQQALEPGEPSL
jgi:hypothetical protein